MRPAADVFAVVLPVLLSSAPSCSSAEDKRVEKQNECDRVAEDIRAAARARGIPSQTACSTTSPPDFKDPCARLDKCNAELAEL